MAEMVSPAGNMQVKFIGLGTEGDKLVMTGQMGIWDTKIYLTASEVSQMLKLAFKTSVIGYIFKLPFLARRKSEQDKPSA